MEAERILTVMQAETASAVICHLSLTIKKKTINLQLKVLSDYLPNPKVNAVNIAGIFSDILGLHAVKLVI